MIEHMETLQLLCAGIVVALLTYALIAQYWSLPLKNGGGFFLGVDVEPGFYEGPGRRWLTRYRAVLLAVHALILGALALLLITGRWMWIPFWAGATAALVATSLVGFGAWARPRVRAAQPRLPAAIALEQRRLSDYIQWPAEALSVAAVGCSWWMLARGSRPADWSDALALSWAVLGLTPGKIMVARQGWPLPAERPEEHRRMQEAARRYSVRMLDAFGWLLASVLFMIALAHAWPAARSERLGQFLLFGVPCVFAALLLRVVIRQKQVFDMSRGLRPAGSWVPPSGRGSMWNRSGLAWFAIWFGGYMVLQFLGPAMIAG
jgi:hypothetical protein